MNIAFPKPLSFFDSNLGFFLLKIFWINENFLGLFLLKSQTSNSPSSTTSSFIHLSVASISPGNFSETNSSPLVQSCISFFCFSLLIFTSNCVRIPSHFHSIIQSSGLYERKNSSLICSERFCER